jgi:hypothetical protein
VKTVELLRSPRCPKTVGELRQALEGVEAGIEPEALWGLGAELGYEAQVGWSGSGAEGRYDVVYNRRREGRFERIEATGLEVEEEQRPWRAYANDPWQGEWRRKLVPELQGFLRGRLPEYMVPGSLVLMEALPLTPNGKVDRRALPARESERPDQAGQFVAPQTEMERAITVVWQEVLGLERVGVHDNFFDLGGHSLLLVRLQSRLREALRREVAIVELLRSPTVSALAKSLSPADKGPSFEVVHQRAGKQREVVSRQKQKARRKTATDVVP